MGIWRQKSRVGVMFMLCYVMFDIKLGLGLGLGLVRIRVRVRNEIREWVTG